MPCGGHAAIQGSTDVPTLYHSIHGYMNAPSALRAADETLRGLHAAETKPHDAIYGQYAEVPGVVLESRCTARPASGGERYFGYDWHTDEIPGRPLPHGELTRLWRTDKVKGMCCVGQNARHTSLNGAAIASGAAAARLASWSRQLAHRDTPLTGIYGHRSEEWRG